MDKVDRANLRILLADNAVPLMHGDDCSSDRERAIDRDMGRLIRAANRLSRYALQACNGPTLNTAELKHEAMLEGHVRGILKPYGLEAVFSDDPRGFSVYIRVPGLKESERQYCNDMGRTGLGLGGN